MHTHLPTPRRDETVYFTTVFYSPFSMCHPSYKKSTVHGGWLRCKRSLDVTPWLGNNSSWLSHQQPLTQAPAKFI